MRLVRGALACAVLVAGLAAASSHARTDVGRYDRLGISFEYPSSWFITTEPLSDGADPDYRFAASTVPVKRTSRDKGPCLAGIARQLPPGAALVFLREYRGASRGRALPRLDPFPRRFSLTPGLPQCFHVPSNPATPYGRGAGIHFRASQRALVLFAWVGPRATKQTERNLRRVVASLEIRPRL